MIITYSADEFYRRAHAGEFKNSTVTVRDGGRRILASGRFSGIVIKLTVSRPHDRVPFYSFSGDVEYRFDSDQSVDVE